MDSRMTQSVGGMDMWAGRKLTVKMSWTRMADVGVSGICRKLGSVDTYSFVWALDSRCPFKEV